MHDDASPVLTLNPPQAVDGFTGAMHDALLGALHDASADAGVRCVVLTGAARGFCAGQDLSDPDIAPDPHPGAAPKDMGALIDPRYKPLFLLIRDFLVPVRAAVNGVAALAETRRAMARADGMYLGAALTMEAHVPRRLGMGAGYLEGVGAFFAGRSPAFTDR